MLGFTFSPQPATTTVAVLVSTPVEVEETDTFEYFVRHGGAPNQDIWVANDLVEDFEDARKAGVAFANDSKIVPGTPEAALLIESLPADVRELVGALQGNIYLSWRDRIYLVTGGC